MNLKKYLERASQMRKGQSLIEYAMLVAITITALLAVNFVVNSRDGAFTVHFNTVAHTLAPEAF